MASGSEGNFSATLFYFFAPRLFVLDLDTYLNDWKTQVAALINDNMSNFDETTQAALQAYVDNNLSSD